MGELSSSTLGYGAASGTRFVLGFLPTPGQKLTAAPGDGDDVLGRGRAAVDLPIFNATLRLGEVFKGAVDSCREVWDIPGLQDQLQGRGKSINTENQAKTTPPCLLCISPANRKDERCKASSTTHMWWEDLLWAFASKPQPVTSCSGKERGFKWVKRRNDSQPLVLCPHCTTSHYASPLQRPSTAPGMKSVSRKGIRSSRAAESTSSLAKTLMGSAVLTLQNACLISNLNFSQLPAISSCYAFP